MLGFFGKFSTRYPWIVVLVTTLITVFFVYQIKTKIFSEADMTKFLPKSMPTTKANDYYKKNFNYRDMMLIGLEAEDGNLMKPGVFRQVEQLVEGLKKLEAEKTFYSKLEGKEVTITQPIGIDSEEISSIANLEDAILDKETGSVVSGSVIAKFKKELNIPYTDETEELLPEKDEDLKKIIPLIEKHILSDRTFRDNMLSEDSKTSAIRVQMIRKWDYKKSYAYQELATAIDPQKLMRRFEGKDSFFKYNVAGKTIEGITYDMAFAKQHAANVKEKLKDHLEGYLEDTYDKNPELQKLMQGELTPEKFDQIANYLEARTFFMHPKSFTWENYVNNLWEMSLEEIDPLSRENLEFKLLNVKDIYDLHLIYTKTQELIAGLNNGTVHYYVAGAPVVTAIFSSTMAKDMGPLMLIAIGIIFLVLLISYRSARGVLIPLITVVLSMVWALGMMAITKTPITVTTSILPIVLLAVGSAYGIHLLNRYYEDIKVSKDRKEVLRQTVLHVGGAIFMAGLTTVAGFSSLASSELIMIQHFGIFTAVGVGFALLLSLTLSPAMLTWWRLPKKAPASIEDAGNTGSFIDKIMHKWAELVIEYPKTVIGLFLAALIGAAIVVPQLKYEGGQMSSFKEDNVVKMADKFLNKNLTGTGQVNLIFKFRDQVNLKNKWAQQELQSRVKDFNQSWVTFSDHSERLSAVNQEMSDLKKMTVSPAANQENIQKSIELMENILNEEYAIDLPQSDLTDQKAEDSMDALNELESMDAEEISSDDSFGDLEDLGGLGDLADDTTESAQPALAFEDLTPEQNEGLKQLSIKLGASEDNWKDTAESIVYIRQNKNSDNGIQMRRQFNLLKDFFAVDVKQPQVLQRLETLFHAVESYKDPVIDIYGQEFGPTGFVAGPVDLVRKFYKVFYHDDNSAFDRLPNTKTDNLADKTLTDRGVIGVVLNQALSATRETFEAMITPDLKEFQLSILTRDSSSGFIGAYEKKLHVTLAQIFPEDDPYIQEIKIGGYAPTVTEVTNVIADSQTKSIGLAFIFVFIVTFFIFKSVMGGIYSIIPLFFTVFANFGTIWVLGWDITTGTMMVASISIGIGVDYTIHFLERYKIQLRKGNSPVEAYFNTIHSSGKAILINALSVSLGFLVLIFSDFIHNIAMGVLMAGTMLYSSLGALSLLPAMILVFKPKFFKTDFNA